MPLVPETAKTTLLFFIVPQFQSIWAYQVSICAYSTYIDHVEPLLYYLLFL